MSYLSLYLSLIKYESSLGVLKVPYFINNIIDKVRVGNENFRSDKND